MEMLIFAILLTISQLAIVHFLFTREMKKKARLEHRQDLLALQLKVLKKDTELLQDSLQHAKLLRHDLRHHYRLLYALLGDGNKVAALEHIEEQEKGILEKEEKDG